MRTMLIAAKSEDMRFWRKYAGLTQSDIARWLKLKRCTVTKKETDPTRHFTENEMRIIKNGVSHFIERIEDGKKPRKKLKILLGAIAFFISFFLFGSALAFFAVYFTS